MNLRLLCAASAITFASGASAMAAGPALSGQQEGLLRALSHCATITDSRSRLACYDTMAPRVNAALTGAGAAKAAVRKPPTKEEQVSTFGSRTAGEAAERNKPQTTPEQFGSEDVHEKQVAAAAPAPAVPPEPKEIDSITATVTDVAFNLRGKFTVFLDNGQIWRELPSEASRVHFKRHGTNTVTIERGFLGSYILHVNDGNSGYKVTRVK